MDTKLCYRNCQADRVMVRGEAPEMFWVRCQGCRICGPCCKTQKEALEAWNKPKPAKKSVSKEYENPPTIQQVLVINGKLHKQVKQLQAELEKKNKALREIKDIDIRCRDADKGIMKDSCDVMQKIAEQALKEPDADI